MTHEQQQHIDHALVPKTHPPMYMMHKYWARKPHNIVREYIEHYSSPGDIVLDPFCGSGVTVIEALKSGRIAIGFDLNPLSMSIIESTIEQVDLNKLEETFEKVFEDVKLEIEKLYMIKCPKCRNDKALIRYVMWSYVVKCPTCHKKITMAEAKKPKGKKQNIYKCPFCDEEFSYANEPIIEEVPVSVIIDCDNCDTHHRLLNPKLRLPIVDLTKVWYPKIRFSYDGDKPFITKRRASTIEELYTPRNLYSLAILYQAISKIPEPMGKVLRLIFSSTLPQASKMMIVTETQGPGWKMPEYLIWATHCEFNVWSRFINRFDAIKRGLLDRNKTMTTVKVVKDFQSLISGKGFALVDRQNVIGISNRLPGNSIDYVFTDPPYGGAIQYYELDVLREAWFHNENDLTQWWKEEITVNKTPYQASESP